MIRNYLPNRQDYTTLATNVAQLVIDGDGRLSVQSDVGFPRIDIGSNVDLNYEIIRPGCIHIPSACELVCEARIHTEDKVEVNMVLRAQRADGSYVHGAEKPNMGSNAAGTRMLHIETSVDAECWISWKIASRTSGKGFAVDRMLLMTRADHTAMLAGGVVWFDGHALAGGGGVRAPSVYPRSIRLEVAA